MTWYWLINSSILYALKGNSIIIVDGNKRVNGALEVYDPRILEVAVISVMGQILM